MTSLLLKVNRNTPRLTRFLSSSTSGPAANPIGCTHRKMRGWQIHSYGENEELQFSDKIRVPAIKSPTDVLVKVEAASINPIDVLMTKGYGSELVNLLRCNDGSGVEFPLTFGRDFAGTIVQKGMGVDYSLDIGEKVCGVVPVSRQGSHAEYVVVDESNLTKKPPQLDAISAAALMYAGVTAWSGIFLSAGLGGISGAVCGHGGGAGKRVLILGATGGVGHLAMQILRAEKANIIATCSEDAIESVKELGAQYVIDYKCDNANEELVACGPYDLILDCAGRGQDYANKLNWSFSNYVTFTSPMLRNFDAHGLGAGAVQNLIQLIETNANSIFKNQTLSLVKWGFFVPSPQGIQYLKKLVTSNKLLPVIDNVFPFEEMKEAYDYVEKGHLRGKVVVQF